MAGYGDNRINCGAMRNQIELVLPGTSKDSFGGVTPGGGASLGTIWASIESLTGRDAVAAQSFSSIATHKVVIRWMAGVVSKCQVLFGSRTFQVEAVLNPDERTKKLILLCVEINDSQQQGA